jgi:hypothetical protein
MESGWHCLSAGLLISECELVQLWPLASFINYKVVPLRLRVLFVNVVAFFWCASGSCLSSPTLLGMKRLHSSD